MNGDFTVTAEPVMYNYSGEIILQDENTSLNYTSVEAEVEIYKTKTIPIEASTSGIPREGYELSLLNINRKIVL